LIKPYKQVYLAPSPQNLWPWGPGWAWEDFDTYFAAEKNALPLWGNQLWAIPRGQNTEFYPRSMLKQVRITAEKPAFRRARNANEFFVPQKLQDTLSIPLLTQDDLTAALLEEAASTPTSVRAFPKGPARILDGRDRDQVLKKMMWQSDNFLAEQILLQVNYQRTGNLVDQNGSTALATAFFPFWREKIRWVDGSGLSRYNLMSPLSIVQALEALYDFQPYESLKDFFPAGGQRGTLKNRYKNSEGQPYVYAKTGSMGQVYCLSGYLETDGGQTLIFSAMYNNFTQPTALVIQEIENKLKTLKSEY
jgi:D-alanyl-D-alanine carboxypeptidase/D-alanyl-D-alanine-endopeptidase (penicillin-binding protein 4)